MGYGITTTFANNLLNTVATDTAFSVSEVWIQVYIGDPGASGDANLADLTTREQATFQVSSGIMSLLTFPAFTGTTTEIWVAYAAWDDPSLTGSDHVLWTAPLATPVNATNGGVYTMPPQA